MEAMEASDGRWRALSKLRLATSSSGFFGILSGAESRRSQLTKIFDDLGEAIAELQLLPPSAFTSDLHFPTTRSHPPYPPSDETNMDLIDVTDFRHSLLPLSMDLVELPDLRASLQARVRTPTDLSTVADFFSTIASAFIVIESRAENVCRACRSVKGCCKCPTVAVFSSAPCTLTKLDESQKNLFWLVEA
ncbi:hypothetical protein M427DRAFT_143656 [Gonapodya prolifera JEL478]|uniref:Uncharacterized protein n=1 Tax=Gonapodya prolifera (strain JEL478) TaxID=1344416 RepID=A0A139ARB2_GONPJ|nr:hypothetical protein M427DRAFT_143656 [Gonapodya prolifera JEL478]|eukprot:KXS19063.1 hypothetical protein M427DRAFT_143656 [Gonapodya prolifera JEL478]